MLSAGLGKVEGMLQFIGFDAYIHNGDSNVVGASTEIREINQYLSGILSTQAADQRSDLFIVNDTG